MSSPFSTSTKTLAIVAGLALVTATVVLWGTSYHSGRLARENAELTYRTGLLASEPQWTKDVTRDGLEKSLRAAYPDLPGNAKISFAAPCWAIAAQESGTMLLKWENVSGNVKWTLLDQVKKD